MKTISFALRFPHVLLRSLLALNLLAGAALAAEPPPNRALRLDGQTGFMEVTKAVALQSISNALTLELWFKAASFYPSDGAVNTLLRKNVEANRENFFLRFRIIAGKPALEFSPGSGVGVLRAPLEIARDNWYHLAATYDGTTARLFVNGALIREEPLSGAMNIDDSPLFVGRGDPNYSSGEYFDGLLDEIRIWNVARSVAEIRSTATTRLTGKQPGLAACWNFDEGSTGDSSGSSAVAALRGKAGIVEAPLPPSLGAKPEVARLPGVPELSADKRSEVLEDLWRHLSETYPALEYKGIYGREWIEPTLAAARQAKDNDEFYGLVLELMASLKDTHTRIASFPGQPAQIGPPVLPNLVEGKVAVIRADPSTGLTPGDVLLEIDGQPVAECLQQELKRVCNSTDRGRTREASERLLRGQPGKPVALTIEGADARQRRVTLRRAGKPGFGDEPVLSSRRLDDKTGYIRIARWGGKDLVQQFDQALEEFRNCAGLVIDVRGNGGGSDDLADQVNGRLISKAVVSSIDFWREAGTDQFHKTIGWVQPRGPWTYEGRVAVLIDEGCASACEHFVSGIEAMKRVLLVGTPTNGAGGGPTVVTLCDGTKLVISRALGVRVNGVVFEGHGIPPHIFSPPSLADLRQGRDAALERAKAWLASGEPVPVRSQALP